MRIAVLSDTRVPTKAEGGHGLGRMAWDIADGLARRGHTIQLWAGIESDIPRNGTLCVSDDELTRAKNWSSAAEVIIDISHTHALSTVKPDAPVINWIADTEITYQPPRAVVGNAWQQKAFPSARIVPLGIDVDGIPFVSETARDRVIMRGVHEYLAYAAKIHAAKGYDLALSVHCQQSIPVRFVGERFVEVALPDWRANLNGEAFYHFIGWARGLLSPCRMDAGGRVNLEAAATGTPVLCLDWTGTRDHVEHGVSGFVCRDAVEMADAVQDLPRLSRKMARDWVRETHDRRVMVNRLEALAQAVADGEMW